MFAGGVLIHLFFASKHPESYAPFGDSAIAPMDSLWRGFVMPHIRLLAVLMAVIEGFIAWGLLIQQRLRNAAVTAALIFFGFLLPLGYGWPADSAGEDFAKNRAGTLVMIGLMATQFGWGRSSHQPS